MVSEMKMRELRRIGRRIEILSRRAQPLARTLDNSPRDSVAWRQAAEKLSKLAGESYRLAIRTGSEELITEAKTSVAVVKAVCPMVAAEFLLLENSEL
jgi:hypothetical protein